jgi:hypothetical protein
MAEKRWYRVDVEWKERTIHTVHAENEDEARAKVLARKQEILADNDLYVDDSMEITGVTRYVPHTSAWDKDAPIQMPQEFTDDVLFALKGEGADRYIYEGNNEISVFRPVDDGWEACVLTRAYGMTWRSGWFPVDAKVATYARNQLL